MESLSEMSKNVIVYFRKKLDSRLVNLDEKSTCFHRTPLHIAVLSDDIKFARKILSVKPDLALIKDIRGWTPLHLASARASLEMVELLLSAEPDACKTIDLHEDKRTPLHLAVMNDRLNIMEVLTEEGLPKTIHLPNDDNGESILHFYVKNNSNIETLELLVEKLALARASNSSIIINSEDRNGKTVLQLAADLGKTKMVQYLVESNKLEISDANFAQAKSALSPEKKNDLETGFLKYDEHGSKKHKSDAFSRNGDKHEWLKERVNALLVVATLIAGIAFQAAMNPPGGVWQEDSKIDSGTEPLKFAYYLENMFSSGMSTGWEYLLGYSKDEEQYYNTLNFVDSLLSDYDNISSMAYKGLILEDSGFSDVVSNYNNSDGNGGNYFPYIMLHAGYSVLSYTFPAIYMNYMVTNGVALFMSLTIIFFVICGFMTDIPIAQVRVLVLMMCISIGCIASAYLSVLVAMLPGFFIEEKRTFINVQIFFGVCCILGIGSFIWTLVWKIVKLRKRKRHQLTGVKNYLREVFHSMDVMDAGKLIVFVVSYFGFRFNGYVRFGTWSQEKWFWY